MSTTANAKLRAQLRRQVADIRSPVRYVIAQPFGGTKYGSRSMLSVYCVDTDTYLMWRTTDKGVYPHHVTTFKRRWLAQLVRDDLARRRPAIDRGMRVLKVRVNDDGALLSSTLRLPARAKKPR